MQCSSEECGWSYGVQVLGETEDFRPFREKPVEDEQEGNMENPGSGRDRQKVRSSSSILQTAGTQNRKNCGG